MHQCKLIYFECKQTSPVKSSLVEDAHAYMFFCYTKHKNVLAGIDSFIKLSPSCVVLSVLKAFCQQFMSQVIYIVDIMNRLESLGGYQNDDHCINTHIDLINSYFINVCIADADKDSR